MKKIKINKGFVVQKFSGKTKIFDGESSVIHTFNGSGSFIFEYLKKGIDKKSLIKILAEKYSITLSQSEVDIDEFIKVLEEKKIIIK